MQQLDDPAAIAEDYQRHCVDLRDLRLVGRLDYLQVPPSQRRWIWEDDPHLHGGALPSTTTAMTRATRDPRRAVGFASRAGRPLP
jgi:hypothetical protein